METVYLLPLTALSLTVALAGLGFQAQRRRGYGPIAVGALAAVMLMIGEFVVGSNAAVYAGIAVLIGTSLWNAWPKRSKSVSRDPTETLDQIGSIEKER